jgi:hypothetical protein
LRIVAILPEERAMQDPVKRSEHYREKAAKYHELAKRAHPPYLGEFYRGIAVRYVFMARELSQQAEKETQGSGLQGKVAITIVLVLLVRFIASPLSSADASNFSD